ncbi:hypothetical protein SLEP1_g35958 [Rubroshorea leprosula]|uniref:Uncharacterized protein n=1 Tax=Rubroshorea leprosula TaxID=152421 RepID=A0AAV5KQE6_9ROSI|nr:hypothetical protein SLEP1_g35958 [Rubroshorea leprosula]
MSVIAFGPPKKGNVGSSFWPPKINVGSGLFNLMVFSHSSHVLPPPPFNFISSIKYLYSVVGHPPI